MVEPDIDSEFSSSFNSDGDSSKSSVSPTEVDKLEIGTEKLRRMKVKFERDSRAGKLRRSRSRTQQKIADLEEQILALITEELGLGDYRPARAPEADKML